MISWATIALYFLGMFEYKNHVVLTKKLYNDSNNILEHWFFVIIWPVIALIGFSLYIATKVIGTNILYKAINWAEKHRGHKNVNWL